MLPVLPPSSDQRLQQIAQARQAVLQDGKSPSGTLAEDWIERSWRRCLDSGQRPDQHITFDLISAEAALRAKEANEVLVQAARPVLEKLGAAIASTRYFAILTNAQGVVVDVNGAIDRQDRRASLITRIGVDLSEASVGTTAIGAALSELQPVWLHRGEHFFNANASYSCAGAPLFGPDGQCAGMLDLTGVDVVERPELKHLVVQSARSIENALTQSRPHELMIRLNWSSHSLGEESDGLICLDPDGWVTGANPVARQMVPSLAANSSSPAHCSELFAMPFEMLFDAANSNPMSYAQAIDVPLWSGLRLQALPLRCGNGPVRSSKESRAPDLPLKDVETALIRKAVSDAKGNVMKAARTLGISRATVYRRLAGGKTK
ncbi:MAG TPA: helix-turn-helix domain-containing protein [Polaromonas sp.]|uniref:sigma-54-dependent Fis family transcriptional regulator n=1 Tax=Polaromonas sp. TaxID=1869339 RepID=UPI002D5105ED|nr:helix-turn-helix domain-containing protein [Polaromonas sp.]HYW57498.1 helix-turn-helix domain-containing protein [Polaromonas sp.]